MFSLFKGTFFKVIFYNLFSPITNNVWQVAAVLGIGAVAGGVSKWLGGKEARGEQREQAKMLEQNLAGLKEQIEAGKISFGDMKKRLAEFTERASGQLRDVINKGIEMGTRHIAENLKAALHKLDVGLERGKRDLNKNQERVREFYQKQVKEISKAVGREQNLANKEANLRRMGGSEAAKAGSTKLGKRHERIQAQIAKERTRNENKFLDTLGDIEKDYGMNVTDVTRQGMHSTQKLQQGGLERLTSGMIDIEKYKFGQEKDIGLREQQWGMDSFLAMTEMSNKISGLERFGKESYEKMGLDWLSGITEGGVGAAGMAGLFT